MFKNLRIKQKLLLRYCADGIPFAFSKKWRWLRKLGCGFLKGSDIDWISARNYGNMWGKWTTTKICNKNSYTLGWGDRWSGRKELKQFGLESISGMIMKIFHAAIVNISKALDGCGIIWFEVNAGRVELSMFPCYKFQGALISQEERTFHAWSMYSQCKLHM